MELATATIKLSGQTANTVIKHNVTPAQLAIYAYMHGEDCVDNLVVTKIDTERTSGTEFARLQNEFTSEEANKVIARLFPGVRPHLPTTFNAVGYDAEVNIAGEPQTKASQRPLTPAAKSAAEEEIRNKIKAAAEQRQAEAGSSVVQVHAHELTDALDDTGHDDDLELDDDPLDLELGRMHDGLPPSPPSIQE